MNHEHLLLDLADRIRNRFYGKYRGTVTQVDESTLRVKANVPAVLGDQESGWSVPCVPYAGPQVGMAFLPEQGAGVWIEFEGGDVSYPIWTGCYWRAGEVPSDAKPSVKAIVTKGKSKFLIDDEKKEITLSDANENNVKLSSDGVELERGGKKVQVSSSKVSVNDGGLEVV
ncbi:MAG: phage baseplate assembly protein V [Planctomycetota bacterium]